MSRIPDAWVARMRVVLCEFNARHASRGARLLVERARQTSARTGEALPATFAAMNRELRAKLDRWQARSGSRGRAAAAGTPAVERVFVCDVGLGGLARWLRAAGYEAHWEPGITDTALLERARQLRAALLTTDSMLMERRILREGELPALWVPPTMSKVRQLQWVLTRWQLPLRPARCMDCGGRLQPVARETVRDRIPPRTYRWLEEYFQCAACGKLFWHGTHWQRIREKLLQNALPRS